MKYRTKLFYAFSILALISNAIALFISYGETSRIVYKLLRENILSILNTASVFMDTDKISTFKTRADMSDLAYLKMKEKLKTVRDINRRYDLYIEYIYVLVPAPYDPNKFVIVMDPDEEMGGTQLGYPFFDVDNLKDHLHEPYVAEHYSMDQYGVYLSGYTPLYDSAGKQIATLGLDVNSSLFHAYHKKLFVHGLLALVLSILGAMLLSRLLSRLVTNSLNHVCHTVDKIGEGDFTCRAFLGNKDEFYDLSISINSMAQGLQERERLKMGFARYVSQFVLDKILQSDVMSNLEGERKMVTVLFSDIRSFTTLSEKMPPEQVVSILNEYFEKMIEAIFKFNGTLDKFIGDGMMVEFGAPLEDNEQNKHAIQAALLMHEELRKLNEKWKNEGKPELDIGIGVHTGLAIVGNIGSEKRMEYTAIGDTVNIASRLEQSTKKHEKGIIVSQPVYDSTKVFFNFEPLGKHKLTGREEELELYSLQIDEKALNSLKETVDLS